MRDFIRVLGVLDDSPCRTRRARERIRRAVVRRFPVLEGALDSSPFGPLAFTIERDSGRAVLDIRFSESLRRSGLRVPSDVRLELIATEPPNLGGERWWFACPACARRCGVVYLGALASEPWKPERWACRRCHGLVYPSQREARGDRAIRRLRKVLRRAGAAFTPSLMPRKPPKGMHRSTFRRLVSEADRWFLRAAGGGRGARRRLQTIWD